MNGDEFRGAARALLETDEVQGVLNGSFYSEDKVKRKSKPVKQEQEKPVAKPEHYKVICISLYNDDLTRLDAMVDELKARGLTKANRSSLIRYALEQVDLGKIPKGIG